MGGKAISEGTIFITENIDYLLLLQRNLDGNILANLKPEGLISMRLGNPKLTKLFDRCPKIDVNAAGVKGLTSQSGGLKNRKFQFRNLGYWLVGDLIKLVEPGSLNVPGELDKQQCRFYFHVKNFLLKGPVYHVEGDFFVHSSFPGVQHNLPQLESPDCYVSVNHLKNIKLKIDIMQVNNAFRSRGIAPVYSRWVYDQTNPLHLINMGLVEGNHLNNRRGSQQV